MLGGRAFVSGDQRCDDLADNEVCDLQAQAMSETIGKF